QRVVDEALGKYHERFAQARAEADREYERQLGFVRAKLDKLEGLVRDSISSPEIDRQCNQIQSDLNPLLNNHSAKLSEAVRPQAQSVASRLEAVRLKRRRWNQQTQL